MTSVQQLIASLPPAKRQFLQWLQHTYPKMYSQAIAHGMKEVTRRLGSGMGATTPTGATASGSFWDSISGALSSIGTAASTIVPTILNAQTQQKVLNLQLQQAAAGKPPLNVSNLTLPPTASASVGLSSSTRMLMWAALGLGGVLVFSRVMKRR